MPTSPRLPRHRLFPSELSPHLDEVNRESLAWMEQFGMLTQEDTSATIRLTNTAWLVSRTNPFASLDLLRLLTDWHNWLFAFDDRICAATQTRGQAGPLARSIPAMMRVLEPPDADAAQSGDSAALADPLACSLADVRQRVGQVSAPDQLERWCHAVREYLLSQVWEAADREAAATLGFTEPLLVGWTVGETFTSRSLLDVTGCAYVESTDEILALSGMASA